MSIIEVLAAASAAYAAAVLATYLFFLSKTPGCKGRALKCATRRELAVIAILIAVQSAVMALVALIAMR
ncbi:MAG: hypothetical protein ABWJ97_07925 [Thermoproteus sp.]